MEEERGEEECDGQNGLWWEVSITVRESILGKLGFHAQ